MSNLLEQIRTDLKAATDLKTQQSFQRFFKEQVKYYGVKTETVGKIAKKYWPQAKTLINKRFLGYVRSSMALTIPKKRFIVAFWLPNYLDHLEPNDLTTFKRWIECYINNWAKCDGFCNHTTGDLIQKYPQTIGEVKSWAKSKNRWLKRASAVSLIVPAKKGLFLKDAFEICDTMLADCDDMVQKGMDGYSKRKAEYIGKKSLNMWLIIDWLCRGQPCGMPLS